MREISDAEIRATLEEAAATPRDDGIADMTALLSAYFANLNTTTHAQLVAEMEQAREDSRDSYLLD